MVLLDVKSLSAEIQRKDLEEVLLGLANSVNLYVCTPLPEEAGLDDFFSVFPEGDRKLSLTYFFVQRRIDPKRRIGIRYAFKSIEDTKGSIGFSVFDNGENVPQELFDNVYSALRGCVVDEKLKINDEILQKEC